MAAKRYELNDGQWAKIISLLPGKFGDRGRTGSDKHRNRIERCFGRMKHFRRFATHYERRAVHFPGFIHLIAAMIWMQ
jgi:transposase